jgi:putative NIF3 family GTP cyclohydrolase 1 type 2
MTVSESRRVSTRATGIVGAAILSSRILGLIREPIFAGPASVTKALRRQLELAFESNIAVYSAHLPLDLHPQLGNNAQLAAALGVKSNQPFFEEKVN